VAHGQKDNPCSFSWLDLILVLKDGKVAEQGTHEELLAKQGLYYDMWTTQRDAASPLGDDSPEPAAVEDAKSPAA